MRRLAALLVLCLLPATGTVFADGKIYCPEGSTVDIPYQRALILHKQGVETLVIQSRYSSDAKGDLGMVVAVPSEPEVAQLPVGANFMFNLLDVVTKPKVTKKSQVIATIAFGLLSALAIVGILAASLSYMMPIPLWRLRGRRRAILKSSLLFLTIILVMAAIILPTFDDSQGVESVPLRQSGIYDILIMKPNDIEALLSWLDEHNFSVGAEDRAAFSDYLTRGWYFVVAKVDRKITGSDALAAPMIIKFKSETPVYPLALSAQSQNNQETLVYVLAEQKMMTDDRMALRYAGQWLGHQLTDKSTEPPGFLNSTYSKMYLCKFKGILTPEKKTKDIIFSPVPDSPYSESVVEW